MTLLNPLFPAGGSLKNVVVEDTTMTGDYAMPDLTYSGTFSLNLEE